MVTVSLPPVTGEDPGPLAIVIPCHPATIGRVRVQPWHEIRYPIFGAHIAALEYRTVSVGDGAKLMTPNSDPPNRVTVRD
jgi:hypothetical protein